MIQTIQLDLPYPPSLNRLYKIKAGGRGIYKSEEAKQYSKDVYFLTYNKGIIKAPTKIAMWITAFPPTQKRKRDLDNLLKVLQDALINRIYDDDSQIDEMHINWDRPVDGGKIKIIAMVKT